MTKEMRLEGYRKLICGFTMIAIGITLDKWGGLSSNLLELLKFVTISFFAANAVEHGANAIKNKGYKVEEVNIAINNLLNLHQTNLLKLDQIMKSNEVLSSAMNTILTHISKGMIK